MKDQINIPSDVVAEAFPAWEINPRSRFSARATSGRYFIYERKVFWYAICQIPVIIVKALWYFILKILAAFGGAFVGALESARSNFVGEHIETVVAKSPTGRVLNGYIVSAEHRQYATNDTDNTTI